MNQLLTIAIPTFNRVEQIQKQVRLILPQLSSKVLLNIFDNCSDIDLRTFFTQEELNCFVLTRNSTNIGADANIARCFEQCQTQWLWTLGDDDFIDEDSVEKVLCILESLNGNVAFVNFNNDSYKKTNDFYAFCKAFDGKIYNNSFWMSVSIYNTSLLNPFLHYYYENLSTMVGTLILVLKYLEFHKDVKCIFSQVKIISNGGKDISWNRNVFIKRSMMLIDAFNDNHYFVKCTIVKSQLNLNSSLFLYFIRYEKGGKKEILFLLKNIIANVGFLFILRHNFYFLLKSLFSVLAPSKGIKGKI